MRHIIEIHKVKVIKRPEFFSYTHEFLNKRMEKKYTILRSKILGMKGKREKCVTEDKEHAPSAGCLPADWVLQGRRRCS